ncbi:hypothetical protein D3C81_723330 [compost metagenome]
MWFMDETPLVTDGPKAAQDAPSFMDSSTERPAGVTADGGKALAFMCHLYVSACVVAAAP